jgi:tripartite-type tricarboxylate transporter receptor subunit TctC
MREGAMTRLIRCLAALAALICSGAVSAQPYPAKPVRLIVPFAPAGPTDVIGRLVAQKLSESWGQQIYVENMPGAGGNTGTANAAKAPPDGYTILVVSTGFIINPSLYAKVPYDPMKDFTPVTLVAASPNVITVHPSVPANTVQELIALIKANPTKYSYAQPAIGSTPHLAGELFRMRYDLDLAMVPFTSAGLAMNSVLGGHTPIGFTAMPAAMPLIQDGKVRGLAVLSARRVPGLPNLPTTAEAGIPDQESDTITGIVAPAGTPKDIVERWQREIARIVALPEINQRLVQLGFVPIANTPEAFGERLKLEMEKWGKVVRDAKLRIE